MSTPKRFMRSAVCARFVITAAALLGAVGAHAADSLGDRLTQLVKIRTQAEQARQGILLPPGLPSSQPASMPGASYALPRVVSISGSPGKLVARVRLDAGVQRDLRVGDSVGGGFSIVAIRPNAVSVAQPGAKGADASVVDLSFESVAVVRQGVNVGAPAPVSMPSYSAGSGLSSMSTGGAPMPSPAMVPGGPVDAHRAPSSNTIPVPVR